MKDKREELVELFDTDIPPTKEDDLPLTVDEQYLLHTLTKD